MKHLMLIVMIAASTIVVAQPKSSRVIDAKAMEAERQRIIAKQGGEILRAGTFTGKVAIIDTQSRLSHDNVVRVAKNFADATKCNFVAEKMNPGLAKDLRLQSKADIALVVVDDADTPVMLLAPEDRWGIVNVSKLVNDLPTESAKKRFFESRGRKEIVRALSILCGGASSQYNGNVMNAATFKEMDVLDEGFPVDILTSYRRYLGSIGIKPKEVVTYLRACREGWAPAPTNETQRLVWEKVRSIPSNPIKIKYDPKVDK